MTRSLSNGSLMITSPIRGRIFILILAGIFLEICAAGLEYKQIIDGISETDLKYQIVAPYSPFIVLASVLIFLGFVLLNVKNEYANMSGSTFYIYLIHAGVWHFASSCIRIAMGESWVTRLNGAIWIPIFVIAVFAISCVICKLYLWIWKKLDKERRITYYLLKIVRLQAD